MRTHLPWCAVGLGLAAFALASGCATESRYYSSVVQYLCPGKSDPVEQPTIPELTLPMKVGVALVPEGGSERRSQSYWLEMLPGQGGRPAIQPLSEQKKMALMEDVSRRLRELPFISWIEHIPSAYLSSGGSFANLDQVRTMYGVDAIALLSYDQMQFTEAGGFSFLWLAIQEGLVPGPRMLPASRGIDAVGGYTDTEKWWWNLGNKGAHLLCSGPAEFERAVRTEIKRGARMIKLFLSGGHAVPEYEGAMSLSKEELATVIRTAHARHAKVRAHFAWKNVLLEAVAAGIDVIDHGDQLDEECMDAMIERGVFWVPSAFFTAQMIAPGAALSMATPAQMAPLKNEFENVVRRVQQARANGLRIDTTDLQQGVSGKRLITDVIDEVQVKSSGYAAEYGGAIGGVVNVVTKTGTNEYHGSVGAYFSDDILDAGRRPSVRIDPTDDTRAETVTYPEDDYSTWEPGFTLGGPIIRDRLWFFGSYIPSLQATERTVTYLSNGETQTVRRTDRSQFATGTLSAQFGSRWYARAGVAH